MLKERINSGESAGRLGAYSHDYKIDLGNAYLIFTTGQDALDRDGNVLYKDNPTEQARYVFKNLDRVLKEAGSSLANAV